MKNVLLGVAAGTVIGYLIRRMVEQGKFDSLFYDADQLMDKAKWQAKNAIDKGRNQVEYVKDRVESAVEKVKN